MRLLRDWLLPALLAGAQLAYWPGARLATGDPVDPELVAGLVAVLGCAVALGWRRRAPLPALAGVLLARALGQLAVPPDVLIVIVFADLVAFYSVAVRRPLRIAVLAGAATAACSAALSLAVYGFGSDFLTEVVGGLVAYPAALALGRSRRRWRAARVTAARRLAEAEADRQRAAGAERRRLARELHDVSAHQLTAIVVTAGAALRLADRRPELVAEAVAFSARTGRETLAALHRLVAVMRSAEEHDHRPLDARLDELAAGFRRLGQPVRIEQRPDPAMPVDLPPALAEVAYGIARESLTNALRHAPGAAVLLRVVRLDGSVEIVVRDAGSGVPAAVAGLGSGRGIAGMRERAGTVGGTLTAGPGPTGWQVRATLPVPAPGAEADPGTLGGPRIAAGPDIAADPGIAAGSAASGIGAGPGVAAGPTGFARWRRPSGARVVDGLLVLGVLAVAVTPLLPPGGLGNGTSGSAALAGAVLVGLVMAAHAVPLWWRRRRPWAALAGVLGTAVLWPVAVPVVPLSGESALVLVAGAVAEFVAVYAVAGHGRPDRYTLLAVPVTALTLSAALLASAAADGSISGQPLLHPAALTPELGLLLILGVALPVWSAMAGVLTVPLLGVWLLGAGLRQRRDGVLAREAGAVARATASAVAAARAERTRIAAGLRAAVLDRAGELVTAADRGRLDAVLEQARSTLTAMRGLLDTLHADGGPQRRAPQPTAGAIGALCADQRAAGRPVESSVPVGARPLPADVDVSAYRVVELALAAGDAGPIGVDLRYGDDDLRIAVTGVPSATDPLVVAGLRARVVALGGEVLVDVSAGRLDVWLPAPAGPSSTRPASGPADPIGEGEVARSPSG